MKRKPNLLIGSSFIALIVACGVGQSVVEEAAEEQAAAGPLTHPSPSLLMLTHPSTLR